jgi:ApaG protein
MTIYSADLGPLSDARTKDIRVEVLSRYSPDNSRPQQGLWVFEYTIRITNHSEQSVQLLSRHWVITDAVDAVKEVKGPGVVGKQPALEPGSSFQYSSWCKLETPTGRMHGTYRMLGVGGSEFDIEIAPFALKAPYTVH